MMMMFGSHQYMSHFAVSVIIVTATTDFYN